MAVVDAVRPSGDVAGRDVVGVVANLLAAVAVGSVLLNLQFAMVGPNGPLFGGGGFRVLDLIPAIVVVLATGLALVPALRPYGWLVATLGLFELAGLYLQGRGLTEDLLSLALAVGVALLLGGVLLALAAATGPGRWALAIGLGFGLVAGLPLLVSLASGLEQVAGLHRYRDEALLGLLALVTAAAGVLLARPSARGDDDPGRRVGGAVIAVVTVAVVARGLASVWQAVLNGIARASSGGFSEERARTVEAWNEAVLLGLGVAIAVALAVVAYRRGGAGLARWVVLGFAVAATAIGATPDTAGWPSVVQLIPLAAVGAALGGLAVVRLDRYVPWDALGLLVVAAGLLLGARGGLPSAAPDGVAGSLLVFGAAFALTAGLGRLSRTGPGTSGGTVAVSAVLGFATLLLCRQLFSGISLVIRPPGGSRLDAIVPLAVAGLVLVLLFWLGRPGPVGGPGDARVGGPGSDPEPVPEG
jgi:hypothetical protein